MDSRRKLAGRLREIRARSNPSEEAGPGPERFSDTEASRALESSGWRRMDSHVYRRETVSGHDFTAFLDKRFPACSVLVSPEIGADSLAFMDIETTGLSGGAGNLAFLVGIGRFRDGRLNVVQYFLADFPGEAEYLRILGRELDPSLLFVTYNGKCFDTNILRTRFLMNGLHVEFPRQLDLLYVARRLWRRLLESCSLGTVEEKVLQIRRDSDVPSYLIPEIYFDFLRSGGVEPLAPVFEHHRYDIETLACLLEHMEGIFADSHAATFVDGAALGEMLLAMGRPEGEGILAAAFERGDREAGKRLSLIRKRRGHIAPAVDIWIRMYAGGTDLFAGTELAKYYEHILKDYFEAERIVEKLLSLPLSGVVRKALRHRLTRIRSKRRRQRQPVGQDEVE